jgi:hypothetical protein
MSVATFFAVVRVIFTITLGLLPVGSLLHQETGRKHPVKSPGLGKVPFLDLQIRPLASPLDLIAGVGILRFSESGIHLVEGEVCLFAVIIPVHVMPIHLGEDFQLRLGWVNK